MDKVFQVWKIMTWSGTNSIMTEKAEKTYGYWTSATERFEESNEMWY